MTELGPVAVDFETYYSREVSITVQGMDAYLRHPECEIYLVSIVGDENEEFVGHPRTFDWASLRGRVLWSHNRTFDKRVYHYLRLQALAEGENPIDWPHEDEFIWHCSADLSVYFRGGRSLKKAAKNLLGWDIVKDVRDKMKGVRAKDMPHMPSSDPDYANFYEQVCGYAIHDSRACKQLALEYGPFWPEREVRTSDLCGQGCHQGIPVSPEKLEEGKLLLETLIWQIEQILPWVKDGYAATSPKGLAEYCRKAGIPHPPSTAEDDSRTQLWEEEYGEQYPWVADMRARRKANILLKRVLTLLDGQHQGWFSYSLKYGGAHTMRFSGGYGG